MKIYHSIEDFPKEQGAIVTIGTFDGVHKGHKIVLDRINSIASSRGLQSIMVTFFPHPRQVLFPEDQILKLINTMDEKIKLLEKTGLDNLIIHNFTKEFSRLESVNFIRDLLVNRLNMKYMVVGYNHQFGKNREGDYDNLLVLSELYDFDLEKIDAQIIDDIKVSSTKIRNLLLQGEISVANNLLGYSYAISGEVIHGDKIGRKIGFPTANIILNQDKLVPKCGVYAVKVIVSGEEFTGMLNIGCKNAKIEVNIFDFSRQIYGQIITIKLVGRLRDEMDLGDLEKLKNQLKHDKINCRKFFSI